MNSRNDPGLSERSLIRFMLLQLHLRIYSVLSSPLIAFPAQLLTSHINFHHQEGREQGRGKYGKIREQSVICELFWRNERNVRWFQLMKKKWR